MERGSKREKSRRRRRRGGRRRWWGRGRGDKRKGGKRERKRRRKKSEREERRWERKGRVAEMTEMDTQGRVGAGVLLRSLCWQVPQFNLSFLN